MTEELTSIFSFIHKELAKQDQKREKILTESRSVIRQCSIAIKNVHRNEIEKATEQVSTIKESINKLETIRDLTLNADSNVQTAYQEFVEATLFMQFVTKTPLLSPETSSNLPVISYLHGLADLVGELRRYCLDKLKDISSYSEAERAMNYMEDIYDNLLSLDFPSGLIIGVRKKTDYVRNIVEKTRGDLVLAFNRGKIEEKINEFINKTSNEK